MIASWRVNSPMMFYCGISVLGVEQSIFSRLFSQLEENASLRPLVKYGLR